MKDVIKSKQTIVVWFSCGAPSAVAAKMTYDKYHLTHNVLIVNNPVDEEDDDNLRFKEDVSKWIGAPVLEAVNTDLATTSAVDVWNKRKYMSGVKGAPCTMLLKKGARYEFERNNKIDWHVLGFTLEEKDRHNKFTHQERDNVIPILIENEITRNDCFEIIEAAGLKLPRLYRIYANANCIGCSKATGITYWNTVRVNDPEVFKARAEQSRRLGVKLVRVKGKRIFLDELDPNAKGHKIKSYSCGIFCDTK